MAEKASKPGKIKTKASAGPLRWAGEADGPILAGLVWQTINMLYLINCLFERSIAQL
mgnify:CR=1 FL=1